MDGRVTSIEFTDEQLDQILEYMEDAGAINVQIAVMNAISVAFDRLEFIDDAVVRCMDCKWYSEKGFCKHPNGGSGNIRPIDWFCADGKRREQE